MQDLFPETWHIPHKTPLRHSSTSTNQLGTCTTLAALLLHLSWRFGAGLFWPGTEVPGDPLDPLFDWVTHLNFNLKGCERYISWTCPSLWYIALLKWYTSDLLIRLNPPAPASILANARFKSLNGTHSRIPSSRWKIARLSQRGASGQSGTLPVAVKTHA